MSSAIIKWFVIFSVALIVQTTVVPTISINGIMPDLILIALFALSIQFGQLSGIFTGFILGLFMDVYSPSLLGQNALSNTIIGAFFGFFNEKMMRIDPIMKVFVLILGIFAHDAIFVGVRLVENGDPMTYLVQELLTRTFPRAFYTTIFLFLIFAWNNIVKPNFRR